MTTSDKTDQIIPAIHAVQQSAGSIAKTSTGQIGQNRGYKYANLNDTWNTIKDLMGKHKLTVIQSPTGATGLGFLTRIYHDSGQFIEEIMPMIVLKQDPQGVGSAITYYRRYQITTMLGLIPDDDSDAREHTLATAAQKMRIIGAYKQAYPKQTTTDQIVKGIQDIVGKYPGNIRQDEAEDAIKLIHAFKAQDPGDTAKEFEDDGTAAES